jgi:predicted O-linked N-acetylglucosamine transferase (SPINDLY family)
MNNQINFLLQQAINCFGQGNLSQTKLLLNNVLKIQPKNFHALHIMGVTLGVEGKHKEARDFLLRAVKINPNDSHINFNLAKALSETGNDLDSIKYHQVAVKIAPKHPEAWLNFGKSLFQLSRYDEALAHYEQAIQLKPDYAEAWSNKGATLKSLKHFDEALAHYEQAIQLKPGYAEAWSNKGAALYELKRYDEALAHYEQAIQLKPDYAEAWSNKGATLHGLKRYDEALAHYEQAIQLKPVYAETLSNKGATLNKGTTLHELKRYDEALAHYEQVIQLKPDYAEAWSNRGATLHALKRYDEALTHYEQAIQLKPDYAEAWSNKGAALNELKRYDEALAYFDEALRLKPDIDWVYGDLVHAKMKICSWRNFLDSLEIISKKIIAKELVVSPFALLALNDDALMHKKSSEIYVQSKHPFNSVLGPNINLSGNQKIRVGYFSADFRNHPVSILTAELFELHDKNRFEIIAFSFGEDDKSPMRLRLSQTFNQFIDVSDMSDLDIAKLSRELCVDIAVDLGGYTGESRTDIFAYRAAPLQISYIGYLGTMGAAYFDYLLADNTIVPEASRKFYSERIAYLPSYQANDRKRIISDKQFARAELSLPEAGFIYCCFNNNYKILPATFDGWMRILKAVDGSILFLYAENEWVEQNLKHEAIARGVDGARLVFGKKMPADEYLARYQACDLFLDTFPYNAGTTASDALWAGLPVLTLTGESFASRMAASILNAIYLPELITSTQREYEALAIELAMNPNKLADIKLKLANNRLNAPLFDTPLFTKKLEAAYTEMYGRHHAGLEPDHISIV